MQAEFSVLWIVLMFVLYSKGNMEPWKLCKQNSDVVKLVFSIVPFGSGVHDELGGISSEAVGIM